MNFSFIGIFIGVIVFIFLAFKGSTLLVSALSATIIIALTGGQGVLTVLRDVWLVGFGGFLQKFFLLFVLSALFGRVMTDGGAAKRIALALSSLIDKAKNKRFAAVLVVPTLYVIMCTVGISNFVAVFTVLSVGKELMMKYDVPWRLYCYGGTASLATFMLPGSLYVTNVISGQITGTNSLTGGMGMGLLATGAYLLVLVLLMRLDIAQADKSGEGFMDTGAQFASVEIDTGLPDDELPNLLLAVMPMLIVILGSTVLKLNVIVALAIGILYCFVAFHKQMKGKGVKTILTAGLTSAYMPVINVAATAAVASVIAAAPGFGVIAGALESLPPLFAGIGLTALVTCIVAGAEATLNSFGPQIFTHFTEAGLTPAIAQRLMCISTFTAASPHSAAIINATTLARIDYKTGLFIYLRGSLLGGLAAVIVAVVCIQFGIFL